MNAMVTVVNGIMKSVSQHQLKENGTAETVHKLVSMSLAYCISYCILHSYYHKTR